jgi:hypothetical protein
VGDPIDENGDPLLFDPNRDDVFYVRSDDGGESFTAPVNLLNSPDDHNRDPVVDADGDLVGIVFEDGVDFAADDPNVDNDEVAVIMSLDGGHTWEDPVNVSSGSSGVGSDPGVNGGFERDDEPSIAVEGETVHVVFQNRPSDPDVEGVEDDEENLIVDPVAEEVPQLRYARSTDNGATFADPVDLPGPPSEPGFLAVDGDDVHIVACSFDDEEDPFDDNHLLYWRSPDGGLTWTHRAIFSDANKCNDPAIDVAGDDVHIAFTHEILGQDPEVFGEGNEVPDEAADVFHLRSDDGGDSFGAARNVSNNHAASEGPSLSIDPTDTEDLHLVWTDTSSFLFTMKYGQKLPLLEGGEGRFANEDVIRWQNGIEMILDGSDVGLRNFRINALARISKMEFVLSFTESGPVPDIGWVDDSDLVLFTATSLGEDTDGEFSRYLDGSDIGLTRSGEDVDAVDIEIVDGSVNLYLSTIGNFSLSDRLRGKDEDIFVCYEATLGGNSACDSTAIVFDGSEAGLDESGDDIDAFSFNTLDNVPEGRAFFSTWRGVDIGDVDAEWNDVVSCRFPEEEPEGTLEDCGGDNSPLRNVFSGDFHFFEHNLSALEIDDRLFDFAAPEEDDDDDDEDDDDEDDEDDDDDDDDEDDDGS